MDIGHEFEGATVVGPEATDLRDTSATEPPPTGGEPKPADRAARLLGGLTALIAALTAIATVNGETARMFRNHPLLATTAFLLVLVAMLCGLLVQTTSDGRSRHNLLVAGSISLVLGFAFGLVAEIGALSLSDRPTISIATDPGGSTMKLSASISGRKAKAHDQLVVTVYGVDSEGRRTNLYYAKTGPDTDGNLAQSVTLDIDSKAFAGAHVMAVEVPEEVLPPNVDCDGFVLDVHGQTTTTTDASGRVGALSFRPNGDDPLVACVTVEFPPRASDADVPNTG